MKFPPSHAGRNFSTFLPLLRPNPPTTVESSWWLRLLLGARLEWLLPSNRDANLRTVPLNLRQLAAIRLYCPCCWLATNEFLTSGPARRKMWPPPMGSNRTSKKKNTHRHTSENRSPSSSLSRTGFVGRRLQEIRIWLLSGTTSRRRRRRSVGFGYSPPKRERKSAIATRLAGFGGAGCPACVCVCRRRSDDRCRAAIDRALDEHRVEFRTSTTSASSAGLVKSDDVLRVLPGWLLSWLDEGPLESCEFYRDIYKINYKNWL